MTGSYTPPGWQPQAPPPRRKHRVIRAITVTCASLTALIAVALVISAIASSGNGVATPDTNPGNGTVATSGAPRHHRLTYVVTGTAGADVTYGPSGSSFQARPPLRKTVRLGHPQYYSIQAQLQGSGHVACKILIDGRVIARGQAASGYNIADCEIAQDPLSGAWQSTGG